MLIFVSVVFVLGRHGCANVVDGVISGVGDGECCSASVCLGGGMLRVSSVRLPSSKVNLRKLTGLGRWPKRKFTAC
jgi:hypothetical protein